MIWKSIPSNHNLFYLRYTLILSISIYFLSSMCPFPTSFATAISMRFLTRQNLDILNEEYWRLQVSSFGNYVPSPSHIYSRKPKWFLWFLFHSILKLCSAFTLRDVSESNETMGLHACNNCLYVWGHGCVYMHTRIHCFQNCRRLWLAVYSRIYARAVSFSKLSTGI